MARWLNGWQLVWGLVWTKVTQCQMGQGLPNIMVLSIVTYTPELAIFIFLIIPYTSLVLAIAISKFSLTV